MENPADGSTVVTNPSAPAVDLAAHKTSGDHDGRYYTEDEVDALLLTVTPKYYEPLTNGDATTPELVFYDGDVVMAEVS